MKKDLEFDKHQVHLRTLLWFRIPSSQFRQPLQLVIEVHGNFLSKGVPWQIENLKNRVGTKKMKITSPGELEVSPGTQGMSAGSWAHTQSR